MGVNYYENFITNAKLKHGVKYDYSFVEYKNAHIKIKINCIEHGLFEQKPNAHLNGQGCPSCKNVKPLTTELLINKSKIIHGNKYDYSLVECINNKTKVKIICPIHGIFEQTPNSHLSMKTGCPKCARERQNILTKSTTKIFIEKAELVHGNKFNYSLVNYSSTKTKVKIICPIHGEFEQRPESHLLGKGCLVCSGKHESNTNDFIEKAKLIHGDKFDYSLVNYIKSKVKVKIICPIHGEFKQVANNHLLGQGCSNCSESHGERDISKYLNRYNINFIRQYKFSDCRDKRRLPFDFYLPEYKICIEFNGLQHYKPIKWFGGQKNFETQQKRDKIKIKYCEENNIELIIIKYTENVDIILENKINKK